MDIQQEFYFVYKYGTYYNPADLHYNEPIMVGCDKCGKEDIKVCLGWKEYDLCMQCVQDIEQQEDDQ